MWDNEITRDMIQKSVSAEKIIDTFPELPVNLYEALKKSVSQHAEKTLLYDDRKKKYSYREVLEKVDELAAFLYYVKSVREGTHVGLLMYNCVEFCVAFLALSKLGAVTVPLPSKFKKAEVLPLIERAEVKVLICDEDYTGWFKERFAEKTVLTVTGVGERYGFETVFQGWENRNTDIEETKRNKRGKTEDTAIIMFTSGTTSQSKGVVLKNYNVMHAVEVYRRTLGITDRDISVIATPIYHITGLVALLGLFVHVGGTLHIHKFFDAKRVIEDAVKYGFTFLHASPTVFNLLIQEGENEKEIPALKSFACGSSNMTKEKLLRLHNWLPHSKFHTVYGLTETTSPATVFPDDAASSVYIGSSGLPVPGTKFKIVNEERKEVLQGEVGEIALSGSVVLDCYYKQQSDSLEDGWLYTGDLGYFNEEGYLYVVDRKKNMINRGGEKIWCYDVENEIAAIEGVQDNAVVGIPDELYGEVAAALIQPAVGYTLTEEKIKRYLKTRMAKYKIPVKIKMVEEIPQTPNGKTDKVAIKKILMEEN